MLLAGWRITGIGTLESGDALTVENGGPASPVHSTIRLDQPQVPVPAVMASSAQDGAGF